MFDIVWADYAGIMPEDIQPTVSANRLFNEPLNISHHEHIRRNKACLIALLPYHAHHLLTSLAISAANDDLGTFPSKDNGTRFANTSG